MKISKIILLISVIVNSSFVFAYGGGGKSQKKCTKPTFSEFTPAHLAETESGAEFSFEASSLTNPESIKVSVKKIPVEINVETMAPGYLIKGRLPESLSSTFARIIIDAKGTNRCAVNDGWLVKIE